MRTALTEALFPFLSDLSPAARRELGALVPVRSKPQSHLLRRGDVVGGAYLVVAGALRVFVSSDGREATLYTVEPGGTCVLALTSTLSREPYPAWVEAGPAGGEFVVMPGTLVHRLLDAESAFRDFVFAELSGRIFDLMRTLEEVGFDQIQQRVARYLMSHRGPDACVRVSQAGIAADLGTAREVVFRALRSLSARRMVETGRLRVRILDPAGLEHVAKGQPAR